MYNREKAIKAQKKYCNENEFPHFAPKNGTCWRCGKNIYDEIERDNWTSGITVEEAEKELIIGCPHCNRSYCD